MDGKGKRKMSRNTNKILYYYINRICQYSAEIKSYSSSRNLITYYAKKKKKGSY